LEDEEARICQRIKAARQVYTATQRNENEGIEEKEKREKAQRY
jgi:hypothetical protein